MRLQNGKLYQSIALPVGVLALMIAFLLTAVKDASGSADKEQYQQTLRAIERAVTSCYAIEGRYPPDIRHIEQKYGVVIDHDRFLVSYDIFASNVRPVIKLIVKGNGGAGNA